MEVAKGGDRTLWLMAWKAFCTAFTLFSKSHFFAVYSPRTRATSETPRNSTSPMGISPACLVCAKFECAEFQGAEFVCVLSLVCIEKRVLAGCNNWSDRGYMFRQQCFQILTPCLASAQKAWVARTVTNTHSEIYNGTR